MRLITLLTYILMYQFVGCQTQTTPEAKSERTESAYIVGNQIPFDGCEESVRLETSASATPIRYKPTSASLPILQKALGNDNQGEKSVTIRFRETGNQVELLCGWGAKPKVGEIEILELTAR
ncbi:hypothetical protein EXU85_12170 [Spirosoma sp. KCTC 42546]|uniref:hypothetical protein n=1 Tax=Spirosoma sp. KCTC 42546 TaxID=2520506 RepID=UPI001156CA79|nr:hypothetical protein [Spirosoma sp. KCTC 42546]QDK79316.1 hypothetical protein EXU85_12170 [Spirosoma sp. KCTC 42546]